MKHEITVFKSDCGELVNRCEIAEEFNTYFSRCVAAATREGSVLFTGKYTDEVLKFDEISEEDTLPYQSCLNTRKATGVDCLSARLLRMIAPGIAKSLTVM